MPALALQRLDLRPAHLAMLRALLQRSLLVLCTAFRKPPKDGQQVLFDGEG